MPYLQIENIFLIMIGASNLVLGGLVYFNDKSRLTNRAFGIWAFSMALWSISSYSFYVLDNPYFTSLLLGRLLYATAIVIVIALLYFTVVFPDNGHLKKRYVVAISVPAIVLFALTVASDLIVKSVDVGILGTKAVFGFLFFLYAIVIIIYVVSSIFLLAKKYKRVSSGVKVSIRLILAGIVISAFGGITASILLPIFNVFNVAEFGSMSTIFTIVFTAYAIAKYNVMDIRVVATKFFAIILSFLLFINIILSRGSGEIVIGLIIFVSVTFVGYLLAKRVSGEVGVRKKLEDLTLKLQRANEDLRILDQAKSEFISIASHQLRTPLSIIKGYISVMLEGDLGKFTGDQEKYLNRVYISNERLIILVNDLLDLSKIESGRMEYKFESVSPVELTKSIVEELESKSRAKKIFLKFKPESDGLPFLNIDRENLRQALTNLVDNGIKYTDKGGVTVFLGVDGDNIVWRIKDTGIGVEPDEGEELFNKFVRGDRVAARYTEGIGLGLYVAKRIVGMHNGKIWIESGGAGKGSTFNVSIPISHKS